MRITHLFGYKSFMKLKKLFTGIEGATFKGSKEIEISGVSANSKLVSPGNLFIAKKGKVDDGAKYIGEAIAAGASAVLTDIFDPSCKTAVQVIHPEVASIEGEVAANYYRYPSEELLMVGITGTNGKTTTSFLVKHLLEKLSGPTGLIGTIEYVIGAQRYQATRTTPDVISNHKMLREMCAQNCKAAVMEVTSHALDQGRVKNIDFDFAIFTNLTLDHLDYHHTMNAYCSSKSLLFQNLGVQPTPKRKKQPAFALVNADSPWSSRILEQCRAKVFTYGMESPADLRASSIDFSSKGSVFTLTWQGKTARCHLPLAGRFNVYNGMAAALVGLLLGASLEKVAEAMAHFSPVPGRLEPVENKLGIKVYVDFAHSDDALLNVLECLSEIKSGRIITVFGCGGDRDASKRPKMAEVAEKYSDVVIVTSDNPRTEDPAKIAAEVVRGFHSPGSHVVELDRKEAIGKAINIASEGDIVLIAGKGHEPYQIFAHKTIEFDDRKIAAEQCAKKNVEPAPQSHA